MILTVFLDGKDVFALFPNVFGRSLIYQLAPPVVWFVLVDVCLF